jgi:hypothetical protein
MTKSKRRPKGKRVHTDIHAINHDWLRPKFYHEVVKTIRVCSGEVIDDKHLAEFFHRSLPGSNKHWNLIVCQLASFVKDMSPARFVNEGPLKSLSTVERVSLAFTVEDKWNQRYRIHETILQAMWSSWEIWVEVENLGKLWRERSSFGKSDWEQNVLCRLDRIRRLCKFLGDTISALPRTIRLP